MADSNSDQWDRSRIKSIAAILERLEEAENFLIKIENAQFDISLHYSDTYNQKHFQGLDRDLVREVLGKQVERLRAALRDAGGVA